MEQARLVQRLLSWVLAFGIFSQVTACQQSGSLQGTVAKPGDQKSTNTDKDKDDDAEAERITPPTNIIGSYLVCAEQEQLNNIQQNASIRCGVYHEPAHVLVAVTNLNQWRVSGSTAVLKAISPANASEVELRFQEADEISLKLAVKKTRVQVQDDQGGRYEGLVSDLLPQDNRLSTTASGKTASLVPLWNEGFEGTKIQQDEALIHDPKAFLTSADINWVTPSSQVSACGTPVFEVMRWATWEGAPDNIGPAEGQQFIDTDSACWPQGSGSPFRGASNLVISKDLSLVPGRVYRVSFKVRQQPLPQGVNPVSQGLQLKINSVVVKDIRTFATTWQEISFDWVAGSGMSRIEWADVGAADDSIGVLLDDLRVQFENF